MDLSTLDLYTMIGFGGVAFYVASYALVQAGKVDGNGTTYTLMNVAAASLVLVSLFDDFNLPSLVTQVIWIAVGLVGLALRSWRQLREKDQQESGHLDNHAVDNPAVDNPAVDTHGLTADAVSPPASTLPVVPSPDVAQLVTPMTFQPSPDPVSIRVRPQAHAHAPTMRRGFDLRPDKAPTGAHVVRLGLSPDLAPAS